MTGHLTADHFDFNSQYDDNMTAYGDYWWAYDGPRTGGIGSSSMGEAFTVDSMVFNLTDTSHYKNHGQYVKEQGSDAAHSCIGMPIVSAPFEWSTAGIVDSTSTTGTTVTLPPMAGTYRIDVLGDWRGDSNINNRVDAEYLTSDSWATVRTPDIDQGDLQVNGQFVDWGTYNSLHAYTLAAPFSNTVNLAVFDGDASTNTKNPFWYTDNAGTLGFTITYVGP